MRKVLLDTDIGSDIDDAVCLAYLLAQPDCDLLGITTVSGQPGERAKIASALCQAAGRDDIPIYPGTAQPLLVAPRQHEAQQAVALANWPHETHFPQYEAVNFLRRTIRAHPGEVTLLTIGPLTNIALLFATDPEIPALLDSLVMMCGFFRSSDREWNALLDPHATAMVYNAPVDVHRSVGLDVTLRVTMPAADVRSRFTTPVLQAVLDFAEVWFQQRSGVTFHDPLAAATLFDDTICTFQRGTVSVDTTTFPGQTQWQAEGTRHAVALEVDSERFFAHYFKDN